MKKSTREERRSRIFCRRPDDATGPLDFDAQPAAVKRSGGQGRFWLILLLCLIGSAGASFVIFKYIAPSVVAPSIPAELVGSWEVMDGDLKGATLEFTWHGTAIATSYKERVKDVTTSSVKIEGKRIFLTSQDPRTRKAETVVQTIVNLTDKELVFRDEDKNTYHLTRIGR